MADLPHFLKITETNVKSVKTCNPLDSVLLRSDLNDMPGVVRWKNRPLEQGNVEATRQHSTGEHYTAGFVFLELGS